MKELYLAKLTGEMVDDTTMTSYVNTIKTLLASSASKSREKIYISFIKNKINEFNQFPVLFSNVQFNIYDDINGIVARVDEWLNSFDSEAIINDIPALIDSYREGDFNSIVKEAIEKKKSNVTPDGENPEPDNPSPEPSTTSQTSVSGAANNIIPELEKMLNNKMQSKKEQMSDIPKEIRDKIEKATAIYMDGIKKAVVDTLDENKDKPNGSTKEERKVEKGQDEKGEAEKEQSEEKKQQEPKEQEIIIQAPVNAATCKKFNSLLSMSVDSKEYRDIFDTLSESQQRYLSLHRASMSKDNQYILAHKNDNSISSSDYNELLKLAKSLTASSKKGSSQKQKNEKKQQQQPVQQQAATV